MMKSDDAGDEASSQSDNFLDDSIRRETENEIIDQIIAAKGKPPSDLPKFTLCEGERLRLLNLCRELDFCRKSTLVSAIEGMCATRDIGELSVRAAEQFLFISGVVVLCVGLYVMLCLTERAVHNMFGAGKNKTQ